jgi:hypothetical protein
VADDIAERLYALEFATGHALALLAGLAGVPPSRLAATLRADAMLPVTGSSPRHDKDLIALQHLLERWARTADRYQQRPGAPQG